jgi:lipoprotein-anchoring transpeptidase ErfK/SrfK
MLKTLGRTVGVLWLVGVLVLPVEAQYYYDSYQQGNLDARQRRSMIQSYYYGNQGGAWQQPEAGMDPRIQYEDHDAEAILRDQMARQAAQQYQRSQDQYPSQSMYDNPYAREYDEDSVRQVMVEARRVASLIKNKNGKPFIIIDKRNFQFYLCDSQGRLLRIGPVAIGKGKTEVGSFETPTGIFPIKAKIPVDDWIRPDWYFIEEGEPIPKRWEDRRVPGFFRYKLVFDGSRYIHYAEATGGRLTHGCLGLDWHDAEAVFHTMEVGSYCIIIDQPFLTRLARGEFPIQRAETKQVRNDAPSPPLAAKAESTGKAQTGIANNRQIADRIFRSLW